MTQLSTAVYNYSKLTQEFIEKVWSTSRFPE